MPELLTKHPKIVREVLASGGIKCGVQKRITPKILTKCPPDSFCSLPGGELCIYGLDQAHQMTQFHCSSCGLPGHRKNNRRFHPKYKTKKI